MKWKHVYTKLRRKIVPQGIEYTFPNGLRQNPVMVNVRIKRWYMPIFLLREAKKAGMSFGWRVAVLWLYYTRRQKKAVN